MSSFVASNWSVREETREDERRNYTRAPRCDDNNGGGRERGRRGKAETLVNGARRIRGSRRYLPAACLNDIKYISPPVIRARYGTSVNIASAIWHHAVLGGRGTGKTTGRKVTLCLIIAHAICVRARVERRRNAQESRKKADGERISRRRRRPAGKNAAMSERNVLAEIPIV